jgi:hypothetical protein
VRTGALNPRAFALVTRKGPGVPAGTASRRAKLERPGGTSPIEPTRLRLGSTGSPLASRIWANTSVSTTGLRPGLVTSPRSSRQAAPLGLRSSDWLAGSSAAQGSSRTS